MYRIRHCLRTLAHIVPVLALCSINPATQAWVADTQAPWVGTALDGKKCSGTQIAYGPYDYLQRDKLQSELQIVEENHFSTDVENLISSETAYAINDIHYTIGAWPNHHRALNSALQYRLQNLRGWPPAIGVPPAECYLQRAIKFSPNDPIPYMLHGLLMHKAKQYDKALTSYQAANRLRPNDVITQYNLGLTLVALKKYKEAEQLAEKVYSAGFPLPGLKKKLIAAGHWKAGSGGEMESKAAKPGLTASQLDALKKAMQEEAARKKATPVAAAP